MSNGRFNREHGVEFIAVETASVGHLGTRSFGADVRSDGLPRGELGGIIFDPVTRVGVVARCTVVTVAKVARRR